MVLYSRHLIIIYAIVASKYWFSFPGSQAQTFGEKLILLDLKSVLSGVDYTPPREDIYIEANVGPQPNDKVARIVFGYKDSTDSSVEIELCQYLESVTNNQLNDFFVQLKENSVKFKTFRMLACKQEDLPQIKIPEFKSYAAVLGFTEMSVTSSSSGNAQPPEMNTATDKWDRVYIDSKYSVKKYQFLDLLDYTFSRANVTESKEMLFKFGSLFHIQSILNVSWTDSFNEKYSKVWNFTQERFCLQLERALRTNNGSHNVEILCALNNYLPINVDNNNLVRISQTFSTIGSTFASINSVRMTDIVNNGFQQLGTMVTFEIIGKTQVARDSQFFTCAADSKICSKHAYCLQQNDGIQCVCALLFTDANEALPGTDCRYSPGAIALIILPSVLFLGSAIVIIGFLV